MGTGLSREGGSVPVLEASKEEAKRPITISVPEVFRTREEPKGSNSRSIIEVPKANEEPLKSIEVPKEPAAKTKKVPYMYQAIIKLAENPSDGSLLEKIQSSGIFLNNKKQKYWVEEKNGYNCFMLFARGLLVTWSENEQLWQWVPLKENSGLEIEVASLLNVCWLEIHGRFETSYLTQGVVYEVVFVVMMELGYGWARPGGGIRRRSKMKRTGSDWEELEEFLKHVVGEDGDERSSSPEELEELLLRPSGKARTCGGGGGGGGDDGVLFADVCAFGFMGHQRDAIEALTSEGQVRGGSQIWSQFHKNLTPRHSSISATMDSQSSLCTGSPTSSLKPKGAENQAPGGTSDSEQSDDESLDIEAGSCEQGTNISELKRMRRMVSNRESARRSRKRKQAHLADLELQVDELRGENASLYKQLTDANHEFTEAATDHRVLKSDVEALRVKVKMAEDLVTRGSLTCSLDHLLQSQITTPHMLNTRNLCRASEVPPIVDLQSVDLQANKGCYIGAPATGQAQNIGMEDNDTKDRNIRMRLNQSSPLQSIASLDNLQSRLSSEITSCETDIWSWDSPTNIMSKQF